MKATETYLRYGMGMMNQPRGDPLVLPAAADLQRQPQRRGTVDRKWFHYDGALLSELL